MKTIKLLMAITAICSTICAILLCWNESSVTCGVTTCKVFETLFVVVALGAMREEAKLKL